MLNEFPHLTRAQRRFATFAFPILAVILALSVGAGSGLAQSIPSSGPETSAEGLTKNLLNLNVQFQIADPSERAQLLESVRALAAARQQFLAALAQKDPAEVLKVALPANLRASMPAAAQSYLEQEVELEGTLEIFYEDRDRESRLLFFLKAAGQRLSLNFASNPPTHLLTGSQVRVRGVRVGQTLALQSGTNSSSLQTLSAVLPNTFGAQSTVVILVNFQDNTSQPYTTATAQGVVFTTTSNFDMENSYQQTWLTGDVVGWYTIPLSYTVCDYSTLANDAEQAAKAAGVNLSAYSHHVYAFPQNACGWWGLGTVGGNPSQAWINGNLALKVVAHEMGHNFGLYHSHDLECGTVTLATSCTSSEYGDTLDAMGIPSAGHFNAFQKERLGWLNYNLSPPLTTVQSSGSYSIDPYETTGVNSKALKIVQSVNSSTGQKTWYYVELRQAIGFDGFLSGNSNVLNGVVVHLGTDGNPNSSYLLDMTPTSPTSFSYPALPVGQAYNDSAAGVTITPTSAGPTGAVVNVTLAPAACVSAKPTVTLSPSQSQWVTAGTTVSYTVSVTDNDSSGCAASSFNLQASVPSGWSAAFAASSLSTNPGATSSTTLQVTSPASATSGFYTIQVTATNPAVTSDTASASATYAIISSFSVAVWTNQPSYSQNSTVYVTASVTANGSGVANVSVTFTITKADGSIVTGTATTGSSGSAVFKFRIKRQDPVGTYQAQATASMGGTSPSVQATTSFTVQ